MTEDKRRTGLEEDRRGNRKGDMGQDRTEQGTGHDKTGQGTGQGT